MAANLNLPGLLRGSATDPLKKATAGTTQPFLPSVSSGGRITSPTPTAPTITPPAELNRIAGQSGFGTFSPFLQNALNPPAAPATQPTTVSSVKDPAVQTILNQLVQAIGNLSIDPNQPQGTLQAYSRSPEVQAQIQTALSANEADVNNTRQLVSDFVEQFLAAQPQAEARTAEEVAAVGRFYGEGEDSIAAELERLREQQRIQSTQNLQRRLGQIGIGRNLAEVQGGVTDSYLNQQVADAIARASLASDIALTEQERSDILSLSDAQARLAGMRNTLMDTTLARQLQAPEAITNLSQANLSRLGQLANLENLNNVFQFFTPQELLAQQLGLLGQAENINLANVFYGLQQPFEPDLTGAFDVVLPQI